MANESKAVCQFGKIGGRHSRSLYPEKAMYPAYQSEDNIRLSPDQLFCRGVGGEGAPYVLRRKDRRVAKRFDAGLLNVMHEGTLEGFRRHENLASYPYP